MKPNQHLYDPFDSELCLIGAANTTALVVEVKRLLHFLEHAPDAKLEDVAFTLATTARKKPAILAVVTSSLTDFISRLQIALPKLESDAARIRDKSGTYYFRDRLCPKGRIAFLFPGSASFYPDMMRDLCLSLDCCREPFDILTEALQGLTPAPMDHLFPPAVSYRNDGAHSVASFSESLIFVYTADMALYRLFEQMGIAPDGLLGFSGGDFAALFASGAFGELSRTKKVLFLREGFQMSESLLAREDLPLCSMITILDPPESFIEDLQKKYPGRITLAFRNSPRQITIALSPDMEETVTKDLSDANIKTIHRASTRPFNTPWCAKVLPTISQFLTHWIRYEARTPVYSCATAERLPISPKRIIRDTCDQWTEPIQFAKTINKMYEDGYRIFIELGARGNMTSAVSETLRTLPHLAVAANRIHRSGLSQLHHALAALAAHGVQLDATTLHQQRRQNFLDFDHPLSVVSPPDRSLRLSASMPTFHLFSPSCEFITASHATMAEDRKPLPDRSDKRRLDFGADFPLLANAEILVDDPGKKISVCKTLSLDDYPFLKDYSIGSSQISYANPQMRGLTILSQISGLEMMCETARKLSPRLRVARVDNLRAQRWRGFEQGAIRMIVTAERISWPTNDVTAVRVQLRDDTPNSAYTSPIMDCIVQLSAKAPDNPPPVHPIPLPNPRQVNWSARDIYPDRLFQGGNLQIIRHVDLWSEGGIDFEIVVPNRANAVHSTHFPLFSIWPTLMDGIVSSFSLWRSHEKFAGAISLPFRSRRISFFATHFEEGAHLRGYLRLFSVTPRSHVADLQISDGNGRLLIEIKGWEELCERVPPAYQQFILRPSERYITQPLPLNLLGSPQLPVAGAVVTNIPYPIFEHNEELWLKSLAHVLLSPKELEEWFEMQGATARRVEWLFGRAVAKDATRRYLKKFHQARWTAADISIWPDDQGKPHPIGMWQDHTPVAIDLSIAHTERLEIAAVVANAKIGIDIEILGRNLSDEFTQGVFSHNELELAANTGDAPTAILYFWCAKEAISKALGTGIRYSPRDLQIISYNPAEGYLEIELTGQWLAPFKNLKGRKNIVQVSTYEGHAFASCILQASLFEGN